MCCFRGGRRGSRPYYCVRKKEDCVFLRRMSDLLVSLQPLAVVLRLRLLRALLSAHNSLRGAAVVISLSNITPQRGAIINKRLFAPADHLEPQ